MNVIRRRGWEISDRLATPEHLVFSRRNFLAGGASALAMAPYAAQAQRVSDVAKLPDPSADLYPAKRNEKYALDRPITDEKVNGNYNNFYEFGTSKTIATAAQALPIRPWTVKIDGMVEKPMEVGIDDLIHKLTLEERTYRHRCVEAWGMAIAWTRLPIRQTRRVRAPARLRQICPDGNLHESEDRARPEAALVSLALYRRTHDGRGNERTRLPGDRRLRPSARAGSTARRCGWRCRGNTASSRSSRSCGSPSPTSGPKGMWEALQASEYGFWANVNPEVPHPRWSQASEEIIGTGERRPTLLFNGYGDYVAGLYKGLENERLWA